MRHSTFIYLLMPFVIYPLQGCGRSNLDGGVPQNIKFQTDYQAVFLDNGQHFIGKLEGMGTEYPVLKEVFYIKNQVNPETKEATSILVKRGQEWHSPELMYINEKHILVIEPVAKDSKMAQLIVEANAQKTGR